ncbi:MAG TPA: hypothetical protein PLT47_07035 [Bacteroidales bacterium]|nr:hypothetical protein [Bacteroidales bacterium]HQI70489.1 hypothetical protein [Bacteroidales bacterium]
MAETLGSLCDKLTIVKLKQYHTEDKERLLSLQVQQENLTNEINEFVSDAINGLIPVNKLTFNANKVYRQQGNEIQEIKGSIGTVFGKLAEINCLLWHEQEKVYDFESVPEAEKNSVVKQLAILNLERTKCIDEIDKSFSEMIKNK